MEQLLQSIYPHNRRERNCWAPKTRDRADRLTSSYSVSVRWKKHWVPLFFSCIIPWVTGYDWLQDQKHVPHFVHIKILPTIHCGRRWPKLSSILTLWSDRYYVEISFINPSCNVQDFVMYNDLSPRPNTVADSISHRDIWVIVVDFCSKYFASPYPYSIRGAHSIKYETASSFHFEINSNSLPILYLMYPGL